MGQRNWVFAPVRSTLWSDINCPQIGQADSEAGGSASSPYGPSGGGPMYGRSRLLSQLVKPPASEMLSRGFLLRAMAQA